MSDPGNQKQINLKVWCDDILGVHTCNLALSALKVVVGEDTGPCALLP